jgi:Zn-finger protein
MKKSYRFFQNKSCEYFPCHKVKDSSEFNCLFCYCPLYALGDNCGGNCTYTKEGIKDCSNCLVPHNPKGYDYINDRFKLIAELAKQNRKESE